MSGQMSKPSLFALSLFTYIQVQEYTKHQRRPQQRLVKKSEHLLINEYQNLSQKRQLRGLSQLTVH